MEINGREAARYWLLNFVHQGVGDACARRLMRPGCVEKKRNTVLKNDVSVNFAPPAVLGLEQNSVEQTFRFPARRGQLSS